MKTLTQHLAQYAGYHRDKRNILTHLVGIPLIVIALNALLSRPALWLGPLPLSPASLLTLLACLFYLRLEWRLGSLMTVLMVLALFCGERLAALNTAAWLGWGIGLFVIGWAFQFIGHYFEGRKPAFVDDIAGLIVGPLFVVAELLFAAGLRQELKRQVEAKAGPLH
ncbi:DUF962 domain-containing protein [Gallaecimonas pentaromativorans]|uniref:Mpo1 family 2-hydroxy fatty acid dioxygenase n=1 Tax=Gallaecimonas pentaromativorans TaxID=584787 RepID=UPI003A91643F